MHIFVHRLRLQFQVDEMEMTFNFSVVFFE